MRRSPPLHLLALLALIACESPRIEGGPDAAPSTGIGDVERAEHWLGLDAPPLPARAQVVALTDRLAIAASRLTGGEEAARLSSLAARLRTRVWRLDRRDTDAREAMELYHSVAEGYVGEQACEARLARATLAGELAADAATTFRELYLVSRRHPPEGDAPACARHVEALLREVSAFRPVGPSWEQLVVEGDAAVTRVARPPAVATAAASVAPAVPASARVVTQGDNLVVSPSDELLGEGEVKLGEVQPYGFPEGGRVVIALSAPAGYEVGTVGPDAAAGRGHRLFVDLARVRMKEKARELEGSGLIERVRVGRSKGGVRVVLDLAQLAYWRVFYLPEPFRVVVDLSTHAPRAAGAPAAMPRGKRVVERVVLDPGHGGEDAGAVGPTGLREKDVTLDIAHRAAPALASELGVETMLTRDADAYVALEERTARANAYRADLFVSIHCNATEDGMARGVQVFMLDPGREGDAIARRAARRENASGLSSFDPVALDRQLSVVAAGLLVARTVGESRRLSELLHRSTFASLAERYPGTDDHGIRTAAFYVLMGAEMPAALYESAFISNPADEALLATADYRQKLADAIVNAVRAYRDGL